MIRDNSEDSQQDRLAALYEVSSLLGSTLDLPQVLSMVMDATIQLTDAERGLLMLRDDLTGDLRVAAARQVEQEDLDNDDQGQISKTVIERTIRNGQPILTNDAQEDERFSGTESVVSYRLRSIMCAPLQARGRIIGAAYVDNRLFAGVFEKQDLELLTAFANQAAMAIDNARLFARTDQALDRRVEELGLFQRIDQELNRSLDLSRVLNLALEWAIRLTTAENGSIGLLSDAAAAPDGGDDDMVAEAPQVLRLLVHRAVAEEEPEGDPVSVVPLEHPVLREVLAERRPVLTRRASLTEALDGTPARNQLAVPIVAEEEVIGIIALESDAESAFLEEDITFAGQLADRAAVAIENARLYQRVQAANRAKTEFVSMVTHELRLPLTAIKGYTDLMSKGIGGALSPQHQEFMDVVGRNLERMGRLINDLSDINRIESGRMRFELGIFDLGATIAEVADGLRGDIERRDQQLTLSLPEESLHAYADRVRTAQILSNLMSNAHKYTPDAGHIDVSVRRNGDMASITVRDDGLGIKEEDQRQLFQQFFRAEDSEVREQAGWGLGLSIVKMLVEAQGGDITFASTYRKGSSFEFTLPLAPAAE